MEIHLSRLLKVGVLVWHPNTLLLREKMGVGVSLLIVWCCAPSGVNDKTVSQSFLSILMWAFSHLLDM